MNQSVINNDRQEGIYELGHQAAAPQWCQCVTSPSLGVSMCESVLVRRLWAALAQHVSQRDIGRRLNCVSGAHRSSARHKTPQLIAEEQVAYRSEGGSSRPRSSAICPTQLGAARARRPHPNEPSAAIKLA